MTTAKKRKPHKQVMWMIKYTYRNSGTILSGWSAGTRRECISRFLDGEQDRWDYFRRAGYRCVKVEVKEIV